VPGDPTVKRLVELYKKLEDAAKEGSAIKGWVVAGKRDADWIYRISEFAPIGEWKKSCRILGAGERAQSASVFPHDSGIDGRL
jgi:hypothetical protein